MTHDPYDERTAVPPRDSSLFYSNGNPKPISTGRLLIRELTSRKAKRSAGRRKERRGDRSRGRPAEDLGEPRPEIVDRDKTENEPVHISKVDRVKMIIFSFTKYVAFRKMNEGTHYGPTHNTHQHAGEEWTEPPTQYDGTESRDHVVELGSETGAACFEPGTALLLQNPLDQDTYDPDQALSRPIGSMKYGDTVLAERQGSRGRGTFSYLAKVTCVMFFEIPQDDNPVLNKIIENPFLNKIIQENTLSSGLGVTLTKHHHIRKHGRVRQDSRGKWHLTHQPKNPVWREAAHLGRDTSSSCRSHIPSVKRVVNLVLDPPGNVVILTPNFDLYISASLGYHMRHGKAEVGSSETDSSTPVYTLKESTDLHGLPKFSQGIIHWGQGAVTRTPDGRLKFNKIRRFAKAEISSITNPLKSSATLWKHYQPRKTAYDCCRDGNRYVGAGNTISALTRPPTIIGNTT